MIETILIIGAVLIGMGILLIDAYAMKELIHSIKEYRTAGVYFKHLYLDSVIHDATAMFFLYGVEFLVASYVMIKIAGI